MASIAETARWWNGNVVNYDTIIKLKEAEDLKPGMSAEVEVIIARYENVLLLPVAAAVEQEEEFFCWVKTIGEPQRRALKLGASNDKFTVVESGLKEGDEVILNPLAFIEEGQDEAGESTSGESTKSYDDASGTGDKQSGSDKKPAREKKKLGKKGSAKRPAGDKSAAK